MTVPRRAGFGLEQDAGDPAKWNGRATADATGFARGDKLPGPYPIDTTGALAGQAMVFNGTLFVPGTAGLQNAVSQTWAFGGGALDYTLDPDYVNTVFTTHDSGFDSTNVATDGLIGDGISVPKFYVLNRALLSGCARTAGGALRLTHAAAANGGPGIPTAGQAPGVLIPLPLLDQCDVAFTLGTNAPGLTLGTSAGPTVRLLHNSGSGTLGTVARFSLFGAGANTANGFADAWATDTNTNFSLTSSVSGGLITFNCILRMQRINAQVLADPTGTPSTSRVNRQAILDGAGRRASCLVFTLGSSSGATEPATLYGELSALSLVGTRAAF